MGMAKALQGDLRNVHALDETGKDLCQRPRLPRLKVKKTLKKENQKGQLGAMEFGTDFVPVIGAEARKAVANRR